MHNDPGGKVALFHANGIFVNRITWNATSYSYFEFDARARIFIILQLQGHCWRESAHSDYTCCRELIITKRNDCDTESCVYIQWNKLKTEFPLFAPFSRDFNSGSVLHYDPHLGTENNVKYMSTLRPISCQALTLRGRKFAVLYKSVPLAYVALSTKRGEGLHGLPRIFSCKCGYLLFLRANYAEQWRSNSFSAESRVEIVGINAESAPPSCPRI